MTESVVGNGTIAVSLTPVALDADSRALRVANTLADIGFRSIVLEGRASAPRFWGNAIEVHSINGPHGSLPAGVLRAAGRGPRRLVQSLRDGRFGRPGEWALYVGFRGYDWWHHRFRAAAVVPRASLYYLHSFEFYRAVRPTARATGARVIYDAHDFYRGIEPLAARRSFDRRRLRPFLDALEDDLMAAADVVVTVSDGVADLIEHTFGRRPAVIRNYHDERRDQTPTADLKTTLGLDPTDRLCVVVGNWKSGMAIATALAALERLPSHFHLAFVGRGYERIAGELAQEGVRGRVHWGIVLPPDRVVPAIRSADVGLVIYTAYSENYRNALPNGFFQVVAAGLPIVRMALPEIEATVGGRNIGICLDCPDGASLAHAIMECARDDGGYRAATVVLARELCWMREAARLRHLIEALFERREGTPVNCDHRSVAAVAGAERRCAG